MTQYPLSKKGKRLNENVKRWNKVKVDKQTFTYNYISTD